MPPISLLIKPSSGNCNLRCKYCFYYDITKNRDIPSYGFMEYETLENVVKKTLDYADEICTFVYQGGEPTLRGLDFFEKSIELEKKYNKKNVSISHALQTNGYGIDKKWAKFFKENNFLVGVSLDGNKATHDEYRKDSKGSGTFYRVMDNINLLKKYNVDFNILTVVNSKTVKQIESIYKFYKKNDLRYLQFIPCLDPLENEPGQTEYSIKPKEYGEFLIKLFDLWYEDLKRGDQPYIRTFENYIAILLGYRAEACDQTGVCNKQYVVEADGEVYPCDFYVLDKYKLGNFNKSNIEEIDDNRRRIGFIEYSLNDHNNCKECSYFNICRGGCRRHRVEVEKNNNLNYFCESYKMFFNHALGKMINIAETIK